MAIVKKVPVFQSLLLASAIALAGCGGGGGGGSNSSSSNSIAISSSSVSSAVDSSSVASSSSVAPPDATPNTFAFSGVTNAEPGIAVVSPAVEITGINTATAISIAGGEYAIDGGGFTTAAGTINNGQTLTIRTIASDKTNTPIDVTVTVGGVSATFTVTTLADVTPDAFLFTAKTDVAVNTEETSEPVTIRGIDIPVPVSITGGLYSINGGEFTASAGTVSADQTIVVKATSGASTEVTQSAVLTVGDVNGTFSVTTVLDTTPPVAEFKFPTPYTMSEANEVKVRGVATDDHAITEVKLVVRSYSLATPEVTIETKEVIAEPIAEGDFSSWIATIPLTADAENEIKVVAIDDRDNETVIEQANKVVIRQAEVSNAFPDDKVQFGSVFQGLVIDNKRSNVVVTDGKRIILVDIASGARSEFATNLRALHSLALDAENDKIYASEDNTLIEYLLSDGSEVGRYTSDLVSNFHVLDFDSKGKSIVSVEFEFQGLGGKILEFLVDKKSFSVISSGTDVPLINSSEGLAVDAANDRLFVTTGGQSENGNHHSLLAVSRADGARNIFSDNVTGQGEKFLGLLPNSQHAGLFHLEVGGSSLYLGEYPNRIFKLSLLTGDRKLISNISYKNASENYQFQVSYGAMQYEPESGLLFVNESFRDSIFVIDTDTEERVILSKSQNDY